MPGCHVQPEQMFNLIWGYNDKWDENLGGTASGATYQKAATTVPAGEVWVLNALSIQNQNRATTSVYLQIFRASGGVIAIGYTAALAQYVPLLVVGMFPLAAGDYVQVYMANCVAADTIISCLTGYKMKLTQ